MAYSINPNLPKARAVALKLLILDEIPLAVVARKCGIHRSTLHRWRKKWEVLNKDWQMDNPNRPSRAYSRANHLMRCTWRVPTESSRPHTSPNAISAEIVEFVLAVRAQLKRCAEVIWHHIVMVIGIAVSLSSVRRILWRAGIARGRKNRVRPDNPMRPHATKPGELVQTDTIHHVNPDTGRRLYYYTVIDLFTRLAHTTISTRLRPGLATQAVLEAQKNWGFTISMVQADNGPEYGRYFEQQMKQANTQVRHSRLHRPNDNAHIERFNRTIQTECIGYRWNKSASLSSQQAKLTAWLEYYNTRRIHLGIQMRTPSEMLQRS